MMLFQWMDTLGKRLRYAREQYGRSLPEQEFTQQQLAEACGWEDGQSRVSNYETGRREPGAEDLCKLCKVLNISISWLACNKGSITGGTRKPHAGDWFAENWHLIPLYVRNTVYEVILHAAPNLERRKDPDGGYPVERRNPKA